MPKSCNLNTEAAPKSDSCSTTYELFTANSIVDRHGGRIWVTAGKEAGSTFHFTLPAAQSNRQPEPLAV